MATATKKTTSRTSKKTTATSKKVGRQSSKPETKVRKIKTTKVVDRSSLPEAVQTAISDLGLAMEGISSCHGALKAESNGSEVYKGQLKTLDGFSKKVTALVTKIETAGDRFRAKKLRELAKTDKVAAARVKKENRMTKLRTEMAKLEADLAGE